MTELVADDEWADLDEAAVQDALEEVDRVLAEQGGLEAELEALMGDLGDLKLSTTSLSAAVSSAGGKQDTPPPPPPPQKQKQKQQLLPPPTTAREIDLLLAGGGSVSEEATEIVEGFLWLGGKAAANDAFNTNTLGITHILNCCEPWCAMGSNTSFRGGRYAGFEAPDAADYPLLQEHFERDCGPFLDKARCQRGGGARVLVHCAWGINRSAAVVVAWLVTRQRRTLRDAVAHVRDKRGGLLSNVGFRRELALLYGGAMTLPAAQGVKAEGVEGEGKSSAPHEKEETGDDGGSGRIGAGGVAAGGGAAAGGSGAGGAGGGVAVAGGGGGGGGCRVVFRSARPDQLDDVLAMVEAAYKKDDEFCIDYERVVPGHAPPRYTRTTAADIAEKMRSGALRLAVVEKDDEDDEEEGEDQRGGGQGGKGGEKGRGGVGGGRIAACVHVAIDHVDADDSAGSSSTSSTSTSTSSTSSKSAGAEVVAGGDDDGATEAKGPAAASATKGGTAAAAPVVVASLGCLAVGLDHRGLKLGRRLLAEADGVARALGATCLEAWVINPSQPPGKDWLLAWYRRNGYEVVRVGDDDGSSSSSSSGGGGECVSAAAAAGEEAEAEAVTMPWPEALAPFIKPHSDGQPATIMFRKIRKVL